MVLIWGVWLFIMSQNSDLNFNSLYANANQANAATNKSAPIFTMRDVAVQRGDFVLCQGVNLALHAGDVCHLIGENGLGKTTLLSQIAGLLPVLSGEMTWHANADGVRQCVYVSHQLGISAQLTVAQNLRFLLALYGVDTDDDVLAFALSQVGLDGLEDVSSAQLSAGQTRRVGLARLFVLTPKHAPFWLLDEPLTALDVAMVARIEARIREFAASGGAVLMTSHQPTHASNATLDLAEFAL
ncbi:heme ABC exporter, ATP-binding protein CcmA [Moraxella caviae]|uniref:Cytochrome c biogenesis ATP-binding export protein CcmA n=2 Tax=Moraxella caviae TaxID=34060 RepID=A0A1T0AAT6_9GAMM|nr:heme ABC exporter, ATP-binding protein CcmA [Moraxella caviae]STZ14162.1 Cytochrome c biogenesis ATP-binding export protein CcmA [Moraxella caviae]VEW12608.1 Cytochrome c biogenesis ATP-binding export protein CcmA [Moraxella caviae]